MLHTKYQGSKTKRCLKFSSYKIYFSLCDLDMQRTWTIWKIIKEGYISIIPVKFGQNPTSSLGGDVIKDNC